MFYSLQSLEKVPYFTEILLTLLNDSTNQVRMIINNAQETLILHLNLTVDTFTELILKPINMSDDIPANFKIFGCN